MICCQFHPGSGLGDMLHRYITVRSLAEEKGYEFAVFGKKNFKGDSFMNLDMGYLDEKVLFDGSLVLKKWLEKDVRDAQGNDIRSYDPEINFVQDNTMIDGGFEDSKYWGHNLINIDKWLKVEPLTVPDDLCVIGFRGGEYMASPELFLPQEYWDKAIAQKRATDPNMRFEVHTDDPNTARKFFPDFPVVENIAESHSKHSNMGYNWRAMRYAKHAIIANSSFYILPRLLAHLDHYRAHTTAPRYWARHNSQIWARPACYYRPFTYI